MTAAVRRSQTEIRAHPSRVISRVFDPGHEGLIPGLSRAQAVIARVLSMSEPDVKRTLAHTLADYSNRHDDLRASFRKNFQLLAGVELPGNPAVTQERAELIGAYFTQEYSIEGAALFNPSIVPAPDQSGCGPDELRFVMSLRAVGEGHLSSIEFRSGVLGAGDQTSLDPPSSHLSTGERSAIPDSLQTRLGGTALGSLDIDSDELARILDASYQLQFARTSTLSERVLFPGSAAESHGLEDARFVRFVEDDGTATYLATYTAYDGSHVAPHMLQTDDFITFRMRPMFGEAAQDKGMALFPRRIGGSLWCLSRWDRENISVARKELGTGWTLAGTVQTPHRPWELIKLGACSSPIETEHGWLVLTHGVGPMRTYAIGALLLDLDDPTKLLHVLAEPLLMPAETERNGYVPNVVYSCGALIHGDTLVLPYGCSDASVRFAFVPLHDLLDDLLASPHLPGMDTQ